MMEKLSQYNVAIRRKMLPDPGEIGSIKRQRMVISGDCQSPKYHSWA
jgi:hypothetical protein